MESEEWMSFILWTNLYLVHCIYLLLLCKLTNQRYLWESMGCRVNVWSNGVCDVELIENGCREMYLLLMAECKNEES